MGFFTPDTSFIESYNDKGKYLLVYRLSLILSALFLLISILTTYTNPLGAIFYIISFVICISAFIYLNLTKKIHHIFWIFTISASLVVTISLNTLLTTLHYPDFIWAVCTIVFAYIGLGKRYGSIFLIFHIISLVYYFSFGINEHIIQLKTLTFGEQMSVLLEMLTAFFALTYLINQYLGFQSYIEKQLSIRNTELISKNIQNEMLMKEIHHRIKNNLQLVISLLRIQSREIDNAEAQLHFEEAINRIMTISIIHQKLYQSEELKNFNFEGYIQDLIEEIKNLNQSGNRVAVDLVVDIQEIGLKTLIPMGLLLNELLTNSYRHAFNDDQAQHQINIHIDQCSPEKICLYYSDSGTWKENSSKGFGLELIEMLTAQMEGTQEKTGQKLKFKLRNLDLD